MMPVIMNSAAMPLEVSALRKASVALVRPISVATTEILDLDFDDDDDNSEFEESEGAEENDEDELNIRRRSQATIASFDEIATPLSSRSQPSFDLPTNAPNVEGPRGPHLFRSSQISTEFAFDGALQLSPLQPKQLTFQHESNLLYDQLAASQAYVLEPESYDEVQADEDYESELRQWSAQEVIDWMYTSGVDATVIECLELHDVNGNVLLDLEFEDLRDLDIASFGKRHQLWNAISALRGAQSSLTSPAPTPFQDTSRPCTASQTNGRNRSRQNSGTSDDVSPSSNTADRRRRGRKASKGSDVITPAESVSIVAIEQLLPRPHKCAKGERCAKWRKQQRELDQLQAEGQIGCFPVSPTKGGRIHVYGDPGNASTAENIIANVQMQSDDTHFYRPQSDALPSVVASSDILGPGQLPQFTLDSETLQQVAHRDPRDNVLQFLSFQHINSPTADVMCKDSEEPINRSQSVPPLFPDQFHPAYPSLIRQASTTSPHHGLKNLPRLAIPRSASAAPGTTRSTIVIPSDEPTTAMTICRSATASPEQLYRFATPASEMDIPVTSIPVAPYARDASQSVPPNMHYRHPNISRSNSRRLTLTDRRRQNLALPALMEGDTLAELENTISSKQSEGSASRSSSMDKVRDPAHHSPTVQQFGYGADCSYAGWMKKRKTKLLRHEWQEAHFRLTGTQLAMHSNARLTAATVDVINVDDYSVACSSTASNSKLSAAMKAFHIKNNVSETKRSSDNDPTAFAFQLVPEQSSRRMSNSRTHHFAVKSKDDRIDWMRELMLAKALQQKGKGYDVEINGVHA